jgi:lipid-binding SYLF domain-containing protein
MRKVLASLCLLGAMSATYAFADSDKAQLEDRLNDATAVIHEIMSVPDNAIPDAITRSATCVMVIPSMKKAAFVVGASYGQGVVTCRTGHGWSAPAFVRLGGASFGFQIGGQATDLVLVAVNNRGMQDLLKSKVKLGVGASVAAGPVGRSSQAATSANMGAELLSYSRSKGIFAGIDLSGDVISQNGDDTRTFYGANVSYRHILRAMPAPAGAASHFSGEVAHYFHSVQ